MLMGLGVRTDLVSLSSHRTHFIPGYEALSTHAYDAAATGGFVLGRKPACNDILRCSDSDCVEDGQAVGVHRLVPVIEVDRDEAFLCDGERQGVRRRNAWFWVRHTHE